MLQLNADILERVCSYLPPDALMNLRLVSEGFSSYATPLLFAEKHIWTTKAGLECLLCIAHNPTVSAAVKTLVVHPHTSVSELTVDHVWDWKSLKRNDLAALDSFFATLKRLVFSHCADNSDQKAYRCKQGHTARLREMLFLVAKSARNLVSLDINPWLDGYFFLELHQKGILAKSHAFDKVVNLRLVISDSKKKYTLGTWYGQALKAVDWGLRPFLASFPVLQILSIDLIDLIEPVPLPKLLPSETTWQLRKLRLHGVAGTQDDFVRLLDRYGETLRDLQLHRFLWLSLMWRPSYQFLSESYPRIERGHLCYVSQHFHPNGRPEAVKRHPDFDGFHWQVFGKETPDFVQKFWKWQQSATPKAEGGLLSLFREDGYLQEDIAIDFPELLQSSMDAEDRFCLRVIAQHLKNSTPQETDKPNPFPTVPEVTADGVQRLFRATVPCYCHRTLVGGRMAPELDIYQPLDGKSFEEGRRTDYLSQSGLHVDCSDFEDIEEAP